VGCQSATLRDAGHSSTAKREVPSQLVSGVEQPPLAAKKPEAWPLKKTHRDEGVRPAAVESKSNGSVSRASLEPKLWQSEDLPPLVSQENSSDSENPLPDSETFYNDHCKELCFRCDLNNALPTLWSDAKGVLNWNNALILTAAGGAAYAMREEGGDLEVREWVADHPNRWGNGGKFLGKLGDAEYQVPVLLGVYGYSLWSQDEDLHEVMGSVLSAVTITGLSVTALKLATNTDRPSTNWANGHYGFPSYHTASTFAIAAILDEYYGCKVGLPAYLLAGAVGFSRLDEQDHDLSDVFFGGALGFVVGKAVAGRHLCGNSKIQLIPYFHPTDGSPGVGGEVKF
jgi:hypothetical protein